MKQINDPGSYATQAIMLIGRDPVKSVKLAEKLNIRAKDVPMVIHFLRDKLSYPVAYASGGYYLATDPKELETAISLLKSRIVSHAKAVRGLKRAQRELVTMNLRLNR